MRYLKQATTSDGAYLLFIIGDDALPGNVLVDVSVDVGGNLPSDDDITWIGECLARGAMRSDDGTFSWECTHIEPYFAPQCVQFLQ